MTREDSRRALLVIAQHSDDKEIVKLIRELLRSTVAIPPTDELGHDDRVGHRQCADHV